jgi:hypothetical protein
MAARLISVSEDTELSDLHDVFQQVLGIGLERRSRILLSDSREDLQQLSGSHAI